MAAEENIQTFLLFEIQRLTASHASEQLGLYCWFVAVWATPAADIGHSPFRRMCYNDFDF